MLTDTSFLALRPEWVLKNDGSQVLLYQVSTNELKYHVLTPQQAVLLAFLDGRHTVASLAGAAAHIFGLSSMEEARALLESTVEELNAQALKIDLLDAPAAAPIEYDPLDFIVSPDQYAPGRRLGGPLALLLFFSARCQTNCVYCYSDLTNMRRLRHLPLKEWARILSEAHQLGICMVELSGGDTLGRPNSISFVEKLIELGFVFMLSTKCYISPVEAQRLAAAGFGESVHSVHRILQISIDSPDAEVADYLAGRKGQLDRVKLTVRNLLATGIEPIVKAVLTPLNYRHVRKHVESFSALGVRHFRFSTYGRSHYRHDDRLFLSDEMKGEAAGLLNDISTKRPDIKIEADLKTFARAPQEAGDSKEKRWTARAGCSAGRTMFGIAPDGGAVLCEQMPLTGPNFVGNLTRQSIMEVWNSPELLDFIYPARDRFAGTACFDCEEFENCIYDRGHCFRESFFAYGRPYSPPPNCPHAPPIAYRSI